MHYEKAIFCTIFAFFACDYFLNKIDADVVKNFLVDATTDAVKFFCVRTYH